MAKKSKKTSKLGLILSIVVILLGILTMCTLFMPMLISKVLPLESSSALSITGADVVATAFASEVNSNMSLGAAALYAFKIAEDSAFVTTVFCWGYILTLCLACASVVFAILYILGLKLKIVNKILGIVFMIIALVTFIFGIIFMVQNSHVTSVAGHEVGTKIAMGIGLVFMIPTVLSAVFQITNGFKK